MTWKCALCGEADNETPRCFGTEAPWRAMVPESEFDQRVELTADQCVVDEKAFFIRGHIEILVHGQSEPLAFSVWSSLSERSFLHMSERWRCADRADDPPYFGWLSTDIAVYPDTINLKLSVQSRAPGLVPLFTVAPSDHPLSLEQRQGISEARWHEIVHSILHGR
ncbi:DUF2199 domain-containing protein [Lysobacter panacisoli]|uniref:DUF2199 domain-containing protein n=1 Tax=Lysobacter panacisoli TaxID=1255263 RepID=A0ABP9L3F3_9GAMM|nr:DUF2199 domain-containing protein [Lysobacter panacisoli]